MSERVGLFEIRRADAGGFVLVHVPSGLVAAARGDAYRLRALAKTYSGWPEYQSPELGHRDGESLADFDRRTRGLWNLIEAREFARRARRRKRLRA